MNTLSDRLTFAWKNAFGLLLWGVMLRAALRFSLSVPEYLSEFFRTPFPEGFFRTGSVFLTGLFILPPVCSGGYAFCLHKGADGKSDISLLLSGFSSFDQWSDSVLDGLPIAFLGVVCYTAAKLLFSLACLFSGKTAAILFVIALTGTVFTFFLFASGIAQLLSAETRSAAFGVIRKSAFHLTLWALLSRFPLLFVLFAPLYPLSLAGINMTSVSPVEITIEGVST